MIAFCRRLLREQPLRFTGVVLALGLAGLVEGIAVAALVPLLGMLAGAGGADTEATGKLTAIIQWVIELFHLPFNLATVLLLVLVIFIGQQLALLFQQKLAQGSIYQFEADLRDRLYRAVLEADWPFFIRERSTEVVSALTMETSRASQAYQYLNQLLGAAIVVAVYFVLAALMSWQMTLFVALAGVAIAIVLRRRALRGAEFGNAVTDFNAELQREAVEDIDAAKLVKGCGVEQEAVGRFVNFTANLAHQQYRQQMNQAVLKMLFESGSIVAVLVGLYGAAAYFKMPLYVLIVFMFVFYRISPRLSTIQVLGHSVLSYLPALERVDEVTARAVAMKERAGGEHVERFSQAIEFSHVTFGYDPNVPTIKNVSVTVPEGKTVAFVGESGSGKTTVVDVMMGMLEPQSGNVLIDGTPLAEIDLHSWREHIGYVAQDSSFFHMSIADNIRLTAPGVSDEEIRDAARLACADEFISELPEHYDTVIGDRGVRLSGGQRQRIALARAIARRPEVLVLDEATSALDAESEQRIQAAIDALAHQMTIVIVTHRLATVRGADLIYVMDAGRVIEQGTWDELLAANGRFAALQRMQELT